MAKVCVAQHSGAHARLSELEQNGGDAANEYGHRIAEHTPTDGIGTKDAGIAGRLEIINGLSASWRIGQAQDHSLQPYPRRTQEGHPVEARNRGCGRVLDSGHHRSPHYTDSATKGFYRIYQTSCRISFVAAGYWSDLGSMPDIHSLSINTIRTLCMDAVQQANCGHPGTPMAMAPVVYVLWREFLRFDPEDPIWPNRDRFILSAGHASTLLYSLLHLAGVKAVNRKYETLGELAVPLDDLKNFRQLESKCPGHPEYRWTSGVETTTGPLGQAVATSVGIAFASKWLAERYSWPAHFKFLVPPEVHEDFKAKLGQRGGELRGYWMNLFAAYEKEFPELAADPPAIHHREPPEGWDAAIPTFPPDAKGIASRDSSGKVLNAIAKRHPWLIGGSADLSPSTKTRLAFEGAGEISRDSLGARNVHFGVREHAMGAILNGLALAKLRVFGSGFLIFSDYGRGSLRLASIMELPVIYIFTHDSIGVGEDGPTHQPVEHLPSLRAIPGLTVIRPCDANEVAEAWRVIMEKEYDPVALILSRQALPTWDRSKFAPASGLRKGGYVLSDATNRKPDVLLIATGSEVSLCVDAQPALKQQGVEARVISMPSWELFEQQDEDYREAVLPMTVEARVSVEKAARFGWERYVGLKGNRIGMKTFGASAPLKVLQQKFGFTTDVVVSAAVEQVRFANSK